MRGTAAEPIITYESFEPPSTEEPPLPKYSDFGEPEIQYEAFDDEPKYRPPRKCPLFAQALDRGVTEVQPTTAWTASLTYKRRRDFESSGSSSSSSSSSSNGSSSESEEAPPLQLPTDEYDLELSHLDTDPLADMEPKRLQPRTVACEYVSPNGSASSTALPSLKGCVLVIDTCSFLRAELDALTFLSRNNTIVVPWVVLNELDYQAKQKNKTTSPRALGVRDWFNANIESIRLQSRSECHACFQSTTMVNDDYILGCAVFFRKEVAVPAKKPLLLVTEDVMLTLKARAEKVDTVPWSSLLLRR